MKSRILATVIFSLAALISQAQTKGPEIKFDAMEHNYGDIMENGGKVNHVFYFTNTGDDTLQITRVQPSCGCTASDWTKDPILPGKQGVVTAVYDPMGRPSPFKKSILVVSNAKSSPNTTLFISGNVIPKPKDFTDTFRIHLGDLLADRNNPVFNNMRFDEVRIDTLRFFNNSDKEMQLSLKDVPSHIQATLSHSKLKVKERGYLVLRYDAGKIETPGNRSDKLFIQTNDVKQESKMIFITSNILERPPKPTVEQLYPYQMGNFRMTKNSVVFPEIRNTESKKDTVKFINTATIPIQLDFQKFPEHLKAVSSANVIMPGKEESIIITYDASRVNGFGFLSDARIYLQTTDTLQALKVIYVSANVKEDFSKLTAKQRENAPVIEFENKIFDFGTGETGKEIKYSFVFSNKGKSDLVIRKVHASCGCTATNPEKSLLKPGETSKIDIVFNTESRVGDQFKSITVISNDPEHPEIMLQVKGKLEKKN